MAATPLENELRLQFRHSKSIRRITQAVRSGAPGLPLNYFGPMWDLMESDAWRRLACNPEFEEAKRLAKARRITTNPRNPRLPGSVRSSLVALSDLAEASSAWGATGSYVPPTITGFSSYKDDLDCCALADGEAIAGAQSGTFIRIHGKGFWDDACKNVVRFGGSRAPVVEVEREALVVQVPILGLLEEREPKMTTGKVSVTVETPAGTATSEFTVDEFENVQDGAFDEAIKGIGRLFALLNARLTPNEGILRRGTGEEASGTARALLSEFPRVSADLVQQLNLVPTMLKLTGDREGQARKMLDGFTSASGLLSDIKAVLEEADDPLSNLWHGSGVTEVLCEMERLLIKTMVYIVVAIIVILIFMIVLVLLGSVVIPGWGSVLVLVAEVLIVCAVIEFVVWVITLVWVALEIVTVAYVVAQAIEKVGELIEEGWDWLKKKLGGGTPPVPSPSPSP
jgi:hypothetical protein